MAGWQSGYAAACKAVYAGSIPASASNLFKCALYIVYNQPLKYILEKCLKIP